jgi:putative CocE/NonD family hydrolase
MLPVRPKQTLSMHTRDGVRLDADIYYPDIAGEFPVLLMRQPYGRAIASTVVYAHPRWYAAHGYIVVIQDVRGRGSSEGEFHLFAHEVEDGEDAVIWAANLPGSTGEVGMYGFSYQGMTQLYAAIAQPEPLKALCPGMVGYDLYQDWAYEGGAFCYQLSLGWAAQLAAETARRAGDSDTYNQLYALARQPLQDPVHVRSSLLQQLAPDSFYHDWIAHPEPDDYWAKLSPCERLAAVDLPMLHIGGWFDPYLRGTLRLYREMSHRSHLPQHLIVGPWGHLPWGRKVGSVDYGAEAASPVDRLQVKWFDYLLKSKATDIEKSAVCLFEMGSNQWRKFDQFPQTTTKPLFILTTGLASMGDHEGFLLEKKPQFQLQDQAAADVLVHDPWRPVPAQGGHATIPAGSGDRTLLDSRTDVLAYTSNPLYEELTIVGEPVVEVYCEADAPSFDLCAVLSEVYPDGSAYNLAQGYRRFSGNEAQSQPLTITLQPICARIPANHALRLSLSASCYPAYPVNAGTDSHPIDSRLIDAQVITLMVKSGCDLVKHSCNANSKEPLSEPLSDECPSRIILPTLSNERHV